MADGRAVQTGSGADQTDQTPFVSAGDPRQLFPTERNQKYAAENRCPSTRHRSTTNHNRTPPTGPQMGSLGVTRAFHFDNSLSQVGDFPFAKLLKQL